MILHHIKRIVLQITITGLIIYWTIGLSLIKNEYDSLVASEKEKMRIYCQTAAVQTSQQMDLITLSLKELAILLNSNYENKTQLDEMISTFTRNTNGFTELLFIDKKGDLYLQPDTSGQPLINVSDREYFLVQQNPLKRGIYHSSPEKSRITGEWILPVSFPLENNKYLSVITAVTKISIFNYLNRSFTDENNLKVTVVRNDGIILARSPLEDKVIGTSVPGEIFHFFSNEKSGTALIKKSRHIKNQRYLIYESVPNYPIKITFDIDNSTMISKWTFRSLGRIIIHFLSTILIIYLIRKFLYMLNDLIKTQKELEILARFDSLTGVMNRRYFFERLQEEIIRTIRYKHDMAVLSLDIDYFKKINDTYGHPEGDLVLTKLGKILKKNMRIIDFIGRTGGEEFIIVLTETTSDEASLIAERLRQEIHSIILPEGYLTVSIGISVLKEKDTWETIIGRTDRALYMAKNNGRDCVVAQLTD